MNRDDLAIELKNFTDKVNNRTATTKDWMDVKNSIKQSYDTNNLKKEMYVDLGKKATDAFKNMGKTKDLTDLVGKVVEKGGTAGAVDGMKNVFANEANATAQAAKEQPGMFSKIGKVLSGVEESPTVKAVNEDSSLLKNSKGFAGVLPMIGMAGLGLAGLSIANKANAGEYGKAGMEAADTATDFIPGVGQAKFALRPSELGNAELPPDIQRAKEVYNAARKAKEGMQEPENVPTQDPMLAPEDRATYDDLKKKFNFNVLNNIK